MHNLSKKLHDVSLELARRRTSRLDCIYAHAGGTVSVVLGCVLSDIARKHPETRATIEKLLVDEINSIQNR